MLSAATYLLIFLVLGNLLAFLAQPGRNLKLAFQEAMGSGVMNAALLVGFGIQAWGLVAIFALKARWPDLALAWAVVWWLSVMDTVHQLRLIGAWRQGHSEAGEHLNGLAYKAWSVVNQLAILAAAIALLWPEG